MKLRSLSVASLVVLGLLATPTEALAVIQSLNNQTGQIQTFNNDPNILINSANDVHSINWNGLLPVSRGGTGNDAFSEGSVIFMGQNKFRQDNNNFFWDRINNRLGIGTPSPASTLDVVGDTSISGNLDVDNIISDSFRLSITAGSADDVGDGGGVGIDGGSGGATSGAGGFVSMSAGNADGSGNGGEASISSGNGGLVSGDGGRILITAGVAQGGNGNGGDILLEASPGHGTGRKGRIMLRDSSSIGGNVAILDTGNLVTPFTTFAFPNASGTFGLLEANQTWNGLNKFEASINSTVYIGSSVKSGCIVLGDSDGSGVTYVTANDGVLSASSIKPSICQ